MATKRKTSSKKKSSTSSSSSSSSSSKRRTKSRRKKTARRSTRKASPRTGSRRYSKGASKKVERAMHEMKHGELRSGRSGRKVTSRKQAIAIGLSEARREGKKVPEKKNG